MLEFHIVRIRQFSHLWWKQVFLYLPQLEFSQDGVIITDTNNMTFFRTKRRLFFSNLPFLIARQLKVGPWSCLYRWLGFVSGKMVFFTCKVILATNNQHTPLGNSWAPLPQSLHCDGSFGDNLRDRARGSLSLGGCSKTRLTVSLWDGYPRRKDWGLNSWVYEEIEGRGRKLWGVVDLQWSYIVVHWWNGVQRSMLCVS